MPEGSAPLRAVAVMILSVACAAALHPESAGCTDMGAGEVKSIFTNGVIYTMDRDKPVAEAVAVAGGRIVDIGDTRRLTGLYGSASRIMDLGGRTVIPGLIDAHAHFNGYALGRKWIDLKGTASLDDMLRLVGERLARSGPGEWITGRGWDQNDWPDKVYPQSSSLDEISPDNPVFLVRVCGHAAIANSAAMRLAGISADSPDPEGGVIMRNGSGKPTGILLDEAIPLVRRLIPAPSREEKKELYIEAARSCAAAGLTGVEEMGIGSETASIYMELFSKGDLPVRLTVYYNYDESDLDSLLDAGLVTGYADWHYGVAGVKFYSDGSLGARSAALLDDYSDDPGNRGLLILDPDELYEKLMECHERGLQTAVHAIGDRGNRIVLDIFERILAESPGADLRHRIEHAQILAPGDIERFSSLGIVPSMQFTHCTSDMPWVADRLGVDRLEGAYAWRSLIDSGCRIPGGSDFPVESIDPLLGIYAAVTRQDLEGKPDGGWFPGQRLTVEEAVRAFTLDAAWAVHQENIKGSLEKGKLADFVILSDDIMNIDPAHIPDITIEVTVLGGEIVYNSGRCGF